MTTINRVDVLRSIYKAFTDASTIPAADVFLDHVTADRAGKASWYTFHLESLYPDRSKTDHLQARGSLRITCRTRAEMRAATGSMSTLAGLVDNVVDALDRKQVIIYGYVAAAGEDPSMVAVADFGQVQYDDLGEPFQNISTAICTVEFLLSGSE